MQRTNFTFVWWVWLCGQSNITAMLSTVPIPVTCEKTALPPWCPLLVVFCESWQHERRWLSQMRWGRRGWGLEGHPWPPLEWTNINSIEKHRQEQRGETEMERENVKCMHTTALVRKMYSANVLCTYIVAFSQEVKCKSICFCCCRKKRQVTRACVIYS